MALAKDISASDTTIHQWLRGSEPSREKLIRLAKSADVSLSWLAEGSGEMVPGEAPEGYVVLKKGPANTVAFNPDWIRQLPGHPEPEALYLFPVEDDAMAPGIEQGDLLLASILLDDEVRDGVYLILLKEPAPKPTIVVRRVGRLSDGSICIFRDNPKYAALDLANPEIAESATIFARVIWSGGLL